MFKWGAETNGVIDTVRELSIGFMPFSPLGRGFLSGAIRTVDYLPEDDACRHLLPSPPRTSQ